MAEPFDCPKCGAPISLQPKPGDETVECPYCHETVIIPEDLRIPMPRPVVVRPTIVYKQSSPVKLVIFVAALVICIGGAVAAYFISKVPDQSTLVFSTDTPTKSAAVRANATADAQATSVALQPLLKLEQAWPSSFTEPFIDNSHQWLTGDVRDSYITGNRSISKGKYTWKVTTVQSTSDFAFPEMADQQDFYVSVDMNLVSMPDDPDADAGMALRHNANDSTWYYFSINTSGQYYFGWFDGTDWYSLIPETDSSAIHVGSSNRLTVGVQGSQFIFIINGQVVDHFIDNNLHSGTIGLGVNLPDKGEKATVEFSNFTILAPAQNP